jgi:hypothetical protein
MTQTLAVISRKSLITFPSESSYQLSVVHLNFSDVQRELRSGIDGRTTPLELPKRLASHAILRLRIRELKREM